MTSSSPETVHFSISPEGVVTHARPVEITVGLPLPMTEAAQKALHNLCKQYPGNTKLRIVVQVHRDRLVRSLRMARTAHAGDDGETIATSGFSDLLLSAIDTTLASLTSDADAPAATSDGTD